MANHYIDVLQVAMSDGSEGKGGLVPKDHFVFKPNMVIARVDV